MIRRVLEGVAPSVGGAKPGRAARRATHEEEAPEGSPSATEHRVVHTLSELS